MITEEQIEAVWTSGAGTMPEMIRKAAAIGYQNAIDERIPSISGAQQAKEEKQAFMDQAMIALASEAFAVGNIPNSAGHYSFAIHDSAIVEAANALWNAREIDRIKRM